ncbi:hypothetical protein [Amycolatopsis sp.]|uniref:hypothetical protein n=1 Tax=Amycolatopsis sp. TaxID=37632 RepID=UPI00260FFC4B|nr:hypothetical protein [Amycolatopsis sp.]
MSTPAGHLEHAAQILAVNALGRYAQEYCADHLSPADFKDDADADVRALADAGLLADPELKAERDMLRIDLNTTEEQLADARRERDLAVAHDRQPYPTAWAYEQACRSLNERDASIDEAFGILRDAGVPLGGESLPNRVGALAEQLKVALWLHAEAVWKRDQTAEALRGAAIVICNQRDRIDKALALLADTALMPMTIGDYQALKFDVRATLTGGAE